MSLDVPIPARPDDEARHRAESLRRVIELISGELALEPLLVRIVESAVELTGSAHGAIGLVLDRPAGSGVRWLATVNLPLVPRGLETWDGAGLAGLVLRAREPVYLERYGTIDHPVNLPGTPGLAEHAVVGIPIRWAQRIIGVFTLGARPPRRYDERDVETLTLFARHAAIAIQNARLYGDLQESLATTQLLYETSRRISTAMSVDEVIGAYLDHVAAGSPYYCSVALYETDTDGRRTGLLLRRRAPEGRGAPLEEFRLPYDIWTPDLISRIDAGELVTVRDAETDERVSDGLRRRQLNAGRPAAALIPLNAGERRLGFVCLTYPEPYHWRDADLQPFQMTAAQLATAIESRIQQDAIQEQGRRLSVLEERGRLARELHDSVTQSLVSLSLLAQTVPALWAIDRDEASTSLAQIRDLSRGALAEMRSLLFELHPGGQSCRTLAARLEDLAIAAAQRIGVPVIVNADATVAVPEAEAHTLARIAQEALANVARHARPGRVTLTLTGLETVRLTIADDGRGFAPAETGTGFGLTSMRERAAGIGAGLRIDSAPGRGTAVTVEWRRPAAGGE